MITAVIQARMSSRRLPGKVLRPINGHPVLGHVAARCSQVVGVDHVVIATSDERSDTPIAEFAHRQGLACYRGPLDNVYERFAGLLHKRETDYFVRVCADSPFLDPGLLETAITQSLNYDVDLITNVFPRSYPKGQSVELIRRSAFLAQEFQALDGFSAEHVTQGFYRHPDQFDILNFSSPAKQISALETWAIDTLNDFAAVNDWAVDHPEGPAPFGVGEVTLHKAGSENA